MADETVGAGEAGGKGPARGRAAAGSGARRVRAEPDKGPTRQSAEARIVPQAGGGRGRLAAAGAGALALLLLLRRRRKRRRGYEGAGPSEEHEPSAGPGTEALAHRLFQTLSSEKVRAWGGAAAGLWALFRLAELRQLRKIGRAIAVSLREAGRGPRGHDR